MLIVQNMQGRIEDICRRFALFYGEEDAACCKAFLTRLDAQGKIFGKSAIPAMQYFWSKPALECVKGLIANPDYAFDADAQRYLIALQADIAENLECQELTRKNNIIY